MRKLLIALFMFLLLVAKTYTEDEIINFLDPYFKKLLVNMGNYDQPLIDLNRDGEIQYSEAEAYTGLLWLSFGSDSLTDITGIKYFINTPEIWLEHRQGITQIDFSGMVNLKDLTINYNPNLEILNISGCKNLGFLICEENSLRKLNAKNCYKLSNILCPDNSMEEIDITECRNLQLLTSTNGHLSKLDFTDCTRMQGIRLSNNQITELDLSYLTKLEGITCDNNQLKKIDVSNSPVFNRLIVNDNQIESVNVRNGNNKSITKFKTYGNPNLKCIAVDDPAYSKENWKEIDEWTEFSEDCSSSIKESKINTFRVFPNPANNTVLIERVSTESADLRILDITGRIYIGYTIPFGETQTKLDISRLSAGKYILEINNVIKSLIIE